MTPAIHIQDLSFAYPDGTAALQGVSLSVAEGESLGVVGPNGAGKSTLVNHLNGFFLPQTGQVAVNGTVLSRKSAERVRRDVGLVFQNPDDQLFMTRVWDDVAFGPANLGWEEDRIDRDVAAALSRFDIGHLRDRAPFHLSQGQKRFAALAAVLVMQPSILVMDEPTSDLDPRNRRRLIDVVLGLDGTRVVASHDLDFIWDVCGRVVLLCQGQVAADGPAHDILTNRNLLEQNGLELPLRLQH